MICMTSQLSYCPRFVMMLPSSHLFNLSVEKLLLLSLPTDKMMPEMIFTLVNLGMAAKCLFDIRVFHPNHIHIAITMLLFHLYIYIYIDVMSNRGRDRVREVELASFTPLVSVFNNRGYGQGSGHFLLPFS